jgi:hypothetical protein
MIQKVSWQEYRLSCWPFFREGLVAKNPVKLFLLLCYHYVDHCAMYTSALCRGGLKELNNLIACTKVIQVAIPSTVSS